MQVYAFEQENQTVTVSGAIYDPNKCLPHTYSGLADVLKTVAPSERRSLKSAALYVKTSIRWRFRLPS